MRTELITIVTDTTPLDGALHMPEDRPVRGGVLLFHGNTMNFYVGAPRWLPPVLTELGFACLAFNRRGHDILSIRDSRTPEGGALQLTREGIADDNCAARWMADRGFPAPVVIAHSGGGMLGVAHAAAHPETPALVLLSAFRGGAGAQTIPAQMALAGEGYEATMADAQALVAGRKHDKDVSRRDAVALTIASLAGAALVLALAVDGPHAVIATAQITWRPFAIVAGVVALGWAGVRVGVFDRLGRRVVPSAASEVLVGAAVIAWVFVLAGITNLDVAVVAATPLALVIAADRGLDGGLLALGIAQAANAGSILLPTANLTTLLALGPGGGGDASYLRHVWLAWLLVGGVTIAALTLLARRRGTTLAPAPVEWSLTGIGADLAAMFVLTSSLRALIPGGIGVGAGFWSAALGSSTLAAAANNLPAAAALHATTSAATWGVIAGLAIGPNLLLTGSVTAVIVRRMAREGGVDIPMRTFTLVGLALVPIQLGAVFVGLRLTGAL
jgi:Na+/H+ antiporter NhaD/arsenite permease-like protein